MYSLVSHKGIYNETIKEYIVDCDIDIESIPINIAAGSKCFVIENSKTYMLNHQKKWILISTNSNIDNIDQVLRDILSVIQQNGTTQETVDSIEQIITEYLEKKTVRDVEGV